MKMLTILNALEEEKGWIYSQHFMVLRVSTVLLARQTTIPDKTQNEEASSKKRVCLLYTSPSPRDA